jgi:hypothetical protein
MMWSMSLGDSLGLASRGMIMVCENQDAIQGLTRLFTDPSELVMLDSGHFNTGVHIS